MSSCHNAYQIQSHQRLLWSLAQSLVNESESMAVIPDEHVEDDVARDDVGVVEAAPHVVERRRQVLPRVRLAQLPQVRQELLLHVNPGMIQQGG